MAKLTDARRKELLLWIERVREGFVRFRAIRTVHPINDQIRLIRQRYALLQILIEVVTDRNHKHKFSGVDVRKYGLEEPEPTVEPVDD